MPPADGDRSASMQAHALAHSHSQTHTRTRTRTDSHTHPHPHPHIHTHTHKHTHTHARARAHTHTRSHARSHARTHARTRSYYLPGVSDTSQRIPTVLYAHGSCVRQGTPSGSVPYRQRQVILNEWQFGRLSQLDALDWIRLLLPLSIAILHCTSLYAVHAPRLASRRTRMFECVALATKASPCQSLPCTGVRALRGRNDIARLVSRSTRTRARAPPCVPNGLIRLVDACMHTGARAGMSRQTSAQLLSTCALDQTPAAVACGVRGLQDHVPTVLRYWESAMAGGGCDGDCVSYLHVTARARAAARPS